MEMMPNIFYINPYSLTLHYGVELNKHIECLPNDAWVVVTDCDVLFLTPNYGRTISNAIVTYPDTSLFTCEVNRLGQSARCYDWDNRDNDSIKHHIKIATRLEREYGHKCELDDGHLAGFFWCFPKSEWLKNKFDSHTIIHEENHKITSFDIRWSGKITGIKRKIKGLYVWHTYRIGGEMRDTSHLEIQ